MRKLGIVAAGFLLWALSAGGARAGLYCTSEPSEWPSPYPFVQIYTELRALPSPNSQPDTAPSEPEAESAPPPGLMFKSDWKPYPSTMKPRYRAHMAMLEAEAKRGALSDEDRINLSFYYIRFQKYPQALEILKPIAGKKNFYALANLATAEFLSGELDRAATYQEEAIQAIPPVVAGWGREQLYALRRVETLFLTLLNHRKSRSLPGRPPSAAVELDPLFPGVHYETRAGDYVAGAIPPNDLAALPPDALPLVMQLLIWLPSDNELYWQFGELLNASGKDADAYTVLDELVVVRKMESPSLRKHRAVLRDARKRVVRDQQGVETQRRDCSHRVVCCHVWAWTHGSARRRRHLSRDGLGGGFHHRPPSTKQQGYSPSIIYRRVPPWKPGGACRRRHLPGNGFGVSIDIAPDPRPRAATTRAERRSTA